MQVNNQPTSQYIQSQFPRKCLQAIFQVCIQNEDHASYRYKSLLYLWDNTIDISRSMSKQPIGEILPTRIITKSVKLVISETENYNFQTFSILV